MPDRQYNDAKALRSLEPVIDALKASISMQKAIANHLPDLEKLRAFGYSNGFISTALSTETGRAISAGLFASMMYRARLKTSEMQAPSLEASQDASITPAIKKVAQSRKPVTRTELRNLRNEEEDWEALNEG